MSDFKVTDLRVGDKLNIGFSAEQFEDWKDRFEEQARHHDQRIF
jgi:hypothetical protein